MNLKVSRATFHTAVKTANGTPETEFNIHSAKEHRRVKMEIDPKTGVLWCEQYDPKAEELVKWFVPGANIVQGVLYGSQEGNILD